MTTMTPPTRLGRNRAALRADDDWRTDAACREVDGDLFFPVGYSAEARRQTEQAKSVCRGCPVVEVCLRWALEYRQDTGVWGGLSEDERRKIHKRMRPVYTGGQKTAVDNILENRLEEFLELVGEGCDGAQIAKALGTNAVTVQKVKDALVADGRLGMAA